MYLHTRCVIFNSRVDRFTCVTCVTCLMISSFSRASLQSTMISNDINNHICLCIMYILKSAPKKVANSTWTMYHHQMAQEISCLFVSRLLWLKRPRALFSLRKRRANRKPSNGEIMVQKLLRCSSLEIKIS